MTTNVFNRGGELPHRPLSQAELQERRSNMYTNLRLSPTIARHDSTKYFYHVRANGRKEKQIKETGNSGNCSVTWKLGKTWDDYKDDAYDMVNAYMNTFYDDLPRLTVEDLALEMSFYVWLYGDESNEAQMRDITEKRWIPRNNRNRTENFSRE